MTRFSHMILIVIAAALTGTSHAEESARRKSLLSVLEYATAEYQRIDREIQDYACYLTKRERVNGRLRDSETMFLKVRHQQLDGDQVMEPLAVYIQFFAPSKIKGREVIYVHGENKGKMIVRNGGPRFGNITTAIAPDSNAAMQESRYPITEVGVKNLVARLIEMGKQELDRDDTEVKVLEGAKINSRPCRLIQLARTERRDEDTFHMARVFVDEQLRLPIRYAAYDWPKDDEEEPRLLEEYTYTKFKINPGFSEREFDHRNPNYQFLKSFEP